ncbi:MAG: sugar phosphate nucleotidyltransferase [Desulfobulbus sp.]|jgi:mannose-1-phosphate guanylyltransferase
MQAFVLAAGYGTRLRPYTTLRPKPLFPVCNQPLVLRLLHQLRQSGYAPVVVNCHHLAGQLVAALSGLPGVLLQEEDEILGTGGGLRRALPRLSPEPLLVINGDLYHEVDPALVHARHRSSGTAVTLALHDYPRFNVVTVQGGLVRGFGDIGDQGDQDGERLAFTGIHVVDPAVLARIPATGFFHIIDLYRQLAEEGLVGYERVDGSMWRDIGTPADYLQLHGELLSGRGWLVDPAARLEAGVVLEDWGCIGSGAVVGAGARLRRCVVWDGARIPANAVCTDRILTGDPKIDAFPATGERP